MSITMRELEILATVRQRWTTLYFRELTRLLREMNGPYLFRPRGRPRQRTRTWASPQRLRRRRLGLAPPSG